MEYVSSQSELGYGKIETYVKLDKLGEVSYWSLIVSIRYEVWIILWWVNIK